MPLFRIEVNTPYVPSKIVFASADFPNEELGIDYEWRTDRIGYSLSLACLERCLDSLNNVGRQIKGVTTFKKQGSEIREKLINRLNKIAQQSS